MIDLDELEVFAVGAVCPTIDAKMTQAMRNALPALIAELRAARDVVQQAQVMCDNAFAMKMYRSPDSEWIKLRDKLAAYDETTWEQAK